MAKISGLSHGYLLRGLEGTLVAPNGKLYYFTADAASLEEDFDEDEIMYDDSFSTFVTKVNILLRLKDPDNNGYLYRIQELP